MLVFPQVPRGDGTLTGDHFIGIERLPGVKADSDEPHTLWAARFVAA